jgi:hypothetical protein
MSTPSNSNESYCTFTLAPDVTAGGLPSEEQLAKDLESTDDNVSPRSRLEWWKMTPRQRLSLGDHFFGIFATVFQTYRHLTGAFLFGLDRSRNMP